MEDEASLLQQYSPRTLDDLPIHPGHRVCTKALFYEFRHQNTTGIAPQYNLLDYDHEHNGLHTTSMYQIYMQCDSEYQAAIVILGSYKHWTKLKKTKWFAEHLGRWEHERNLRDEAVARTILVKLAESGNVTAANSLYKNSQANNKKTAGRPPKGGQRIESSGESEIEEMFTRSEDADK